MFWLSKPQRTIYSIPLPAMRLGTNGEVLSKNYSFSSGSASPNGAKLFG